MQAGVEAFTIDQIDDLHGRTDALWHEFLRVSDLSMGLYVLPAGGEDPQNPHNEDEVYHILSGQGVLRVDKTDYPVGPGSVIYVARHLPHKFHSIAEELRVLVFFAPAHT